MTELPPETEGFKNIPGFPGYQASAEGKIRTFREKFRKKASAWRSDPLTMKTHVGKGGYAAVSVRDGSKTRTTKVHKLVLLAFFGTPAEGLVGCHNDGDKSNNHISNLRWDTLSSNQKDRILHGTQHCGEKNSRARFKEKDVLEMRQRRIAGESCVSIANDFRTNPNVVWYIVNRKVWKHI